MYTQPKYADPASLTRLKLLAPLALDAAVELHNPHCRYYGLHWEPSGDELMVYCGNVSGTANWQAWITFEQHRTVHPHLHGWELGDSDTSAEHMLIVDRTSRQLYVASVQHAHRWLQGQWGPVSGSDVEPLELTAEMIDELLANLRQQPGPSLDEINRRLQDSQRNVERLRAELDRNTLHCPTCAHPEMFHRSGDEWTVCSSRGCRCEGHAIRLADRGLHAH